MQIECTSAELANLVPLLTKLSAFNLSVVDKSGDVMGARDAKTGLSASTSLAQPVVDAQSQLAIASNVSVPVTRSTSTPWMTAQEVADLFGYASPQGAVALMRRAGVQPTKLGKRSVFYDRAEVERLNAQFDETLSIQDAADLAGFKSDFGVYYHLQHRRITPTMVAGHTRFKLSDVEQFMKLRRRP